MLKPASRTPIGALIIGEVLAKAPHMPKGALALLSYLTIIICDGV